MMTLKPVNCCMAWSRTPRKTARRTFLLDLNKDQPACFTFSVSLISFNSDFAKETSAWRVCNTFSASEKRPLAANQRGLSGSTKTVKIKMTAGMAMTVSIIRQEPL